ncbi:MAG TPA: DoxX family protein [Pilimelia sp.]|nr:DoxX family protein [Pilimelia sp.]
MDPALWLIQGLLAIVFVAAGVAKLLLPKERLHARMTWTRHCGQRAVWTIGALDVLGGVGVLAPGLTGVAPTLAVAAAAGLALIMVGAFVIHLRHAEYARAALTVLLFLCAVAVVVGRSVIVPH